MLMIPSRHLIGLDARRFQQEIGERLDQTFGIGAQWALGNPTTQIDQVASARDIGFFSARPFSLFVEGRDRAPGV